MADTKTTAPKPPVQNLNKPTETSLPVEAQGKKGEIAKITITIYESGATVQFSAGSERLSVGRLERELQRALKELHFAKKREHFNQQLQERSK